MSSVKRILPLLLLFFVGSCATKPPTAPAITPERLTNVRAFQVPYRQVWKTLIRTLQYDFLIPLEVNNEQKGYFSSQEIRDVRPFWKSKYRISGTVISDGKITTVTIYKHLQLLEGSIWKAKVSDRLQEHRILDRIGQSLANAALK